MGRWPLSVLPSPHLGAPSRDTQGPTGPSHAARSRTCACVEHVSSTPHWLPSAEEAVGQGTGTEPFLAPLKPPPRAVSSRGVSMVARVSSCRRGLWPGKRVPARAGSPRCSAAKESERVTSLPSPLSPTSLLLCTGSSQPRRLPQHRADPRGCHPARHRRAVLIFKQ